MKHNHQYSQSTPHERRPDVAIIGGSAAGLAAALQLGRQRRSVVVIDSGDPRNAPAAHMHSYLGHEGVAPETFVAIGREEVRSYGVEILDGYVTAVSRTEADDFRVVLSDGRAVVARKVLAATGLSDELPEIEGLAEHWGTDVIHCPFCHGYEVRDRRIVQIVTYPAGLHPAPLFRRLATELTIVLHGDVAVDPDEISRLEEAGVEIVAADVRRVTTGDDGSADGVELVDGRFIRAEAIGVGPKVRARAEAFAGLGLHPAQHPSGLGDYIEVDETGETKVPGLFAAGNVTDFSHQVLQAAAHGSRVGAFLSFVLAREDMDLSQPRLSEWDLRYSGEKVWSGRPNPALVAEAAGMTPGRALDVGAGEGGDALWLAENGWQVTATDISSRALGGIESEAADRELTIELIHADANDLEPFPSESFDLVTAHYASIPRTPDGRAVRNLMSAVAPGGVLLVVDHDMKAIEAMPELASHMVYDHAAYVSHAEFRSAFDVGGWEIEVDETRSRASESANPHHINDLILRARRTA